jgi:catechol 2,3-dioxygenase-like lactoylglutathione lyase family enzyme
MSLVIGPAVDHVGVVVPDLNASVRWFRDLGFQVSDPTPLHGEGNAPLGQHSAHIVLPNGYVEISSPVPGSGNHLLPYLALGPGIRILALASDSIAADHARLSELGMADGPVRSASRVAGQGTAHFRWFSLSRDFWPGVLVAVVQHLTPELVFASELCIHQNRAKRFVSVDAWRGARDWSAFDCSQSPRPRLALRRGEGGIFGLSIEAEVAGEHASLDAFDLRLVS